jgi:hypothetical protein
MCAPNADARPRDDCYRSKGYRPLVLNQTLLIKVAGLAAPEKTNPAGEEPTSDETAQAKEHAFPEHERDEAIRNGAADNGISRHEEEKMQRANDQKPTSSPRIFSKEFSMGPERFAQSFIVESERDLHRTKRKDQAAHYNTLDRQIIQDAWYVHEIREQQRHSHDQHAHQHDDPRPFQDVTEAAHSKSEEFAFFKAESADPGETDRNEINLNVNAKQVFENEGDGIHAGRNLQQPRGRK